MSGATGPLAGTRVIDLTEGWAGPFCTMELGDLGADVIKVEPPGGDRTRHLGGPGGGGTSLPFLAVNRSKRSICVDLATERGVDVVRRLAVGAEVLVESAGPGHFDEVGLGAELLHGSNPGLVYASVTGFGQDGPYRDWASSELVAQAMGGMVTQDEGGDPIIFGGDQLSLFVGKYLFHGVVAALFHSLRTGEGQRVDVSMFEAAIARSWVVVHDAPATAAERPAFWAGAVRAFRTADMPVEFNFRVSGYTPDDQGWMTFFRKVGADELIGDDRFATEAARTEHFAELKVGLEGHLANLPAYEVMRLVGEGGGMAAPWHTVDLALAHPQAEALGMTATTVHPTIGPLRTTNMPYTFHGTPATIEQAPPTLGQHTLEILEDIGCTRDEVLALLEDRIVG